MDRLSELHKQIAACRECRSFKEYWRFPHESHGQYLSRIMIVGESSHKHSIDAGKYYAAGSLRSILESVINLEQDCYLTDLVKCDKAYLLPKGNIKEVAHCCYKYLIKEIEFVSPKVIIAVGELAFRFLTGVTGPFSQRQGDSNLYQYQGIPVIPVIHPSYENVHYGKITWQKQTSYSDDVRNIFKKALNM